MAESKTKLLLIEDDMFLRELCVVKLKKANFDVDYAEDGEEGLQKMQENAYDVILLDIMLPEKDGFEILETYNKTHDKLDEDTILIMLTNLSEREQVEKAKDLGADDYIIKAHFSPSEIVDKTQEWLNKKNT